MQTLYLIYILQIVPLSLLFCFGFLFVFILYRTSINNLWIYDDILCSPCLKSSCLLFTHTPAYSVFLTSFPSSTYSLIQPTFLTTWHLRSFISFCGRGLGTPKVMKGPMQIEVVLTFLYPIEITKWSEWRVRILF